MYDFMLIKTTKKMQKEQKKAKRKDKEIRFRFLPAPFEMSKRFACLALLRHGYFHILFASEG